MHNIFIISQFKFFVIHVLLQIKYWLMLFGSLLVFILFAFKKISQHFRNSGCRKNIHIFRIALKGLLFWKKTATFVNVDIAYHNAVGFLS